MKISSLVAHSSSGQVHKLVFAIAAASMVVTASSSHAALFLSDNFTVTSNSQNVNQETPGIRQSGSLASSSSYVLGPEHHQVGNTTTDVGQPGGILDGNHVLLAFNGWFQSSFEVGAALANGGPLTIGFDMYLHGANPGGGDDTKWAAFTLRAVSEGAWPIANPGEIGWLFRANGGVQMFQTTSNNTTYDVPGQFTSPHWELTFSDTAGTGSAFNGNGSVLHMVNGAGPTIDVPLGQLNATGLVLGFRNFDNRFAGLDNLTIIGAPEPSTMLLLAGGIGLAAFRRRMFRG